MKITYQQQPELINIHRLNLSHIVKSQCTHLLLHLPPHTLKLVPAPLCVWKHPWGQNPTLHTWIDHAAVAAINVKWVFVRESRRRLWGSSSHDHLYDEAMCFLLEDCYFPSLIWIDEQPRHVQKGKKLNKFWIKTFG